MSKIEELQKLKKLLDDGVLNNDEFQTMKDELLSKETSKKQNTSSEPVQEKKEGILTIGFGGQWFLFDAKIKIYVNEELNSQHSIKKGFSVEIPLTSKNLKIKVTLSGLKSTTYQIDELDTSKDYLLGLIYDNALGKFSNEINITEHGKSNI